MNQTKDGIRIAGVNTRYYPTEYGCPGTDRYCNNIHGTSENPPPTTAVVVLGDPSVGDYAVYLGHSADPVWVAKWGNKVRFEEAQCHFPSLEKSRYRE